MRRFALFLVLTACYLLPATIFAAGDVDLLWQGESYTPPFYQGRSLWGVQADITFTAIPHIPAANGREADPSTLIYRWKKDGVVLGSLSGVNKRSLVLSDTVLSEPVRVKIDILLEPDTEPITGTAITVTPVTPELLVYEDNPLYGVLYNNAVGNLFILKGAEVTFSAFPLYAGVRGRNDSAEVYTWITGSDTRKGGRVTYRIPDGASGFSEVTLKAVNSRTIAQPGDKSFRVQFENENPF